MRIKLLASIAALAALTGVFGASADATVYWGDGSAMGRINNNGSFPHIFWGRYGYSSGVGQICGLTVDGDHLYWADRSRETISRSNLGGLEVDLDFITDAKEPCGVVVNDTHIFWANYDAWDHDKDGATIGRARLDGSEVIQDFVKGVHQPCGVAVDGSYIYWGERQEDAIARIGLDGKGVPETLVSGAASVCSVAVDETYLFWGGFSNAIGRAAIDGSEPEFDFLPGIERPCDIAVDGSRIYWSEEGYFGVTRGRVGFANLDGSGVNPSFVTEEILHPCGIAVDPGSYEILPPHQGAGFRFGKIKRNLKRGTLRIALHFPQEGRVEARAYRGINFHFLPERTSEVELASGGMKWLRVSAAANQPVGRKILRQIRRHGRRKINLRIEYFEEGKTTPGYFGGREKEITLRKRKSRAPRDGKRSSRKEPR